MRISEEAARRAVSVISAQYGDGAKIWLFGSRVDDQKRGGDVDIFVETESMDALRRVMCKSELTEIFDLKVDLIVGLSDKPIHRIAKATGVRLR